MEDFERIYSLLLHSNGLKLREIADALGIDKYYVAEIMFSPDNHIYWFQDDNSLWFAKEGALMSSAKYEDNEEDEDFEDEDEDNEVDEDEDNEVDEDEDNEVDEDEDNEIDENSYDFVPTAVITSKFNIEKFLENPISDSLLILLKQISHYHVYSNEDVCELVKKTQNGDRKAYDLLVRSQQRLIANIALYYKDRGLSIEDLIQEGNIGLIRAIYYFDYHQYNNFAIYAKSWIMQSMIASFRSSYMVKFPQNLVAQHRIVHDYMNKYELLNGIKPVYFDEDEFQGIDDEKLDAIKQQPDDLNNITLQYEDLDFMQNQEEVNDIWEEENFNINKVRQFLSLLKVSDQKVIMSYYGMGTEEKTIYSIGVDLRLTRERVRQLLSNGIARLKKNAKLLELGVIIGDTIYIESLGREGTVIGYGKKNHKGYLYVKMISGEIFDFPADISFKIIKRIHRHTSLYKQNVNNLTQGPHTNKEAERHMRWHYKKENNYWSIESYKGLKINDRIYYKSDPCTVVNLLTNSQNVKLAIEYDDNGVMDVVDYDPSDIIKIFVSDKYIRHFHKNSRSVSWTEKREACIGDRIKYRSEICTVSGITEYGGKITRLLIKYDDGRIDNVPNNLDNYVIIRN